MYPHAPQRLSLPRVSLSAKNYTSVHNSRVDCCCEKCRDVSQRLYTKLTLTKNAYELKVSKVSKSNVSQRRSHS